MAGERLLAISDLHLGPATQERSTIFLEFLERALKKGDEVWILGDLFDLWFGWQDLTFAYQASILQRMVELKNAGLRMNYVEGNRDFGIAKLQGVIFEHVCGRSISLHRNSRLLHLEHGDLVNRKDRTYRLWRTITKNPVSYFIINSLPSAVLLKSALKLEQKLKKTNLKFRLNYPVEESEKFSMQEFRKGADLVIIGHFHRQKLIAYEFEGKTRFFCNLPGWEEGFQYLVIPGDTSKPYFEKWEG
jgi:UDP-2,3-diacylglucosamine hydrolase